THTHTYIHPTHIRTPQTHTHIHTHPTRTHSHTPQTQTHTHTQSTSQKGCPGIWRKIWTHLECLERPGRRSGSLIQTRSLFPPELLPWARMSGLRFFPRGCL